MAGEASRIRDSRGENVAYILSDRKGLSLMSVPISVGALAAGALKLSRC